ncbi:cold shock domain-containing protein [Bacteroidales bacterium OttesenSCG-928-C19]|nr:cold shock domain-containing protein [Bacteroidales bacterium OttesenSCG-928-C19]
MARPMGSKKDNEKKKIAKRKEKEKRKEERKNSGEGKSFEDMIAYVDENGNIVSERPEIKKIDDTELESIQISTPRRTEADEVQTIHNGKVEHFNTAKGYGFIRDADNGEKYFFHISNSPANIAEGNKVSFEIKPGSRGMELVNIKIV